MSKRQEAQGYLEKAQNIVNEAKSAGRAMTEDEHEKCAAFIGQAVKVREEMAVDRRDDELRDQLKGLFGEVGEVEQKADAPEAPVGTLADQFLNDPNIKAWMKQVAPGGHVPERSRITSPPVQIKGFGLWGRKELVTGLSPTSAGAFVTPDDTGIYERIGRFPLAMRDLISVRQTGSDTVEFVRQTRQVQEAAPVPEANVKYPTGATGEIDGKKPQGRMNFERVQETVKTVAVYVGATKRALADASQIRGIIDQELREDLAEELEQQIIAGDGVGENFRGVENYPGTLTQAFGVDILTTTRRAITNLLINGRQMPTAWVFHPSDWETVELIQDNEGRYYHNGPLEQGPARLWGVPVAQSFFVTAGTAWLANWRKAVLWDRQQTVITATDSHEDWFIRNMVAILGELRAAFGLIRPSAFVETELS